MALFLLGAGAGVVGGFIVGLVFAYRASTRLIAELMP